MKRFHSFILLVIAISPLLSCGSSEKLSRKNEAVVAALEARNFNVVLTQTIPGREEPVYYPTGTYVIRVRGNNAKMSLPKLSTEAGSTFETGYIADMDLKEEPRYNKGQYLFRFGYLPNKNYVLEIHILENGSARITGRGISAPFYGQVELIDND